MMNRVMNNENGREGRAHIYTAQAELLVEFSKYLPSSTGFGSLGFIDTHIKGLDVGGNKYHEGLGRAGHSAHTREYESG